MFNFVDIVKHGESDGIVANIDEGCSMDFGMANGDFEMSDDPDLMHSVPYKWVVDQQFKEKKEKLHIPSDPAKWTVEHVRFWVCWAVHHFKLHGVKLHDWNITGQMLLQLTYKEFKDIVPSDPGDMFWTHLELLRHCKLVFAQSKIRKKMRLKAERADAAVIEEISKMSAMHTANTQLWMFLLDLLTNAKYVKLIRWEGTEGEFKFVQPEKVARLWGMTKNNLTMNYNKLARALRYYYYEDMIAKVSGKKFGYKFVCDLEQLIGFDVTELTELVNETDDYMQARRCIL